MTLLAGCAGGESIDEDESKLIVSVVNRSTDEDPVSVRVTLDGELVVNDDFGQGLDPGEVEVPSDSGPHLLVATSSSGVIHEFEVELEPGASRWVRIDFWYAPDDPRHFTVTESDRPFPTDRA